MQSESNVKNDINPPQADLKQEIKIEQDSIALNKVFYIIIFNKWLIFNHSLRGLNHAIDYDFLLPFFFSSILTKH